MERKLIKSCCGNKGYTLVLDAPLGKPALDAFKKAGYKTTDVYTRVGVFFVERNGMSASGPYGGAKLNVRCGGSANCSQLLDHLENTFKMLDE